MQQQVKAVVVPSALRGLHLDFCGEKGFACHFQQAKADGTSPELEMTDSILASCPLGCSCEDVKKFMQEKNLHLEQLPGFVFQGEGLCLHIATPKIVGKSLHYVSYLKPEEALVCSTKCGHSCSC